MAPDERSCCSSTGSTPSIRDATETASPSHVASQASDPSVAHTPDTASSSTSRRGRGPTRGLVLERLTRESRVAVEFPHDCLRPVGDNARLFTSEVGVLCRSLIPATTSRWADVTDDVRQFIRQRLTDKFILDLSIPYISYAVDDMVKEWFKEYCGDLHQRYKRCISHEEVVLSEPLHVTSDDWRILCKRFSSEPFKKRSRINFANKGKLEVNQVAGSKSFVRFRHEMRSEPEIMSEVFGTRSGYVCGLCYDAKLMAPSRATSSRSIAGESALRRVDILEREVQHLRVVIDEIRDQLERQKEQERRIEEMRVEHERWMEEMRVEHERRMEEMRVEHERRMKEMLEEMRVEHERRMEEMFEEMRVEHERQMEEMFQAIAARLPTDAPPPPPSSL